MAIILPFSNPPAPEALKQAIACIQDGGVVAIPTDSFYALAVGAFNPGALRRVQAIKGQRDHNPFPVLVSDPEDLDQVVAEVPPIAEKLMQQFWPGLLTLVLKAKPYVLPVLKNQSGYIGVRQPNNPQICKFLEQAGPLTGTSANHAGQSPAQSAEVVLQLLGSEVDLILDGGETPGGEPSTVIELEPELRILRQGAISQEALEKALQ